MYFEPGLHTRIIKISLAMNDKRRERLVALVFEDNRIHRLVDKSMQKVAI